MAGRYDSGSDRPGLEPGSVTTGRGNRGFWGLRAIPGLNLLQINKMVEAAGIKPVLNEEPNR